MIKKQRRNAILGFTLTEILMVVVILGILASAVLPRLSGQTQRAKTAEAVNIMSAIRRGLMSYYDDHLGWPADLGTAADMEEKLGVTFGAIQHGWTITTVRSGDKKDCTVKAQHDKWGSLSLDVVNGTWSGTGDYCDSSCEGGQGQYWPYLDPTKK